MAEVAGIYRLVVKMDGEVVGRDAKTIPSGRQLAAVEATLPLTAGLFGRKHEIEVRVEFEPAVAPEPPPPTPGIGRPETGRGRLPSEP